MNREETIARFKSFYQKHLENHCSEADEHMFNNVMELLERDDACAEWVYTRNGWFDCSNCGFPTDSPTDYCPNCGRKMTVRMEVKE